MLKKDNSQTQKKHKQSANTPYRYFFKVALLKGPEFYKYEGYKIPVNKNGQKNYEIIQKIGRGKYSDVYKAISVNDQKYYVLKILKPVRQQKIKRQIKILNQLNHPNIVKLFQVLYDEPSKCYCLVLQFVDTADYCDLIDAVDSEDIRQIMHQILKGLLHCHQKGIMHRDIKPQNLLIDYQTLQTKISDWGLAEYYLPGTDHNIRVASRHYKGPQLLLNNRFYDFSLDIWSLGLVFGGLLLRKHTLFHGDSNPDQLNQFMKHFGSNNVQDYVKQYRLEPDQQSKQLIKNCNQKERRPWSHYINKENSQLCDQVALDLLDQMLQINHEQRINVIDALEHDYFSKFQKKPK